MDAMRIIYGTLIIFLLSPLTVSAYTFQEQAASPDSVRLVLNQGKSQGDIIAIDVMAYEVSGIESAAFDLDFDEAVIEWEGAGPHDPDGFDRGTFFDDSGWYAIANERYLVSGILVTNESKLVAGVAGDSDSPRSGSGTIMTVKFRIIGTGTSMISFSNNALIMPDGSFSGTSWYGGTLVVDSVPSGATEADEPPLVSLLSPADQEILSESDVELACTASDDYGLENITLYTDIGGLWSPYATLNLDDMDWTASFQLAGLSENIYTWNCQAYDSSGQDSFAQDDHAFTIQLPADYTPPQRMSGQPSGNLASGADVNLSIDTNEDAACRYSSTPGIPYNTIPYTFTTANKREHTIRAYPSDGSLYNYYVRCMDENGNANEDDYLITFSVGDVPADSQAPVIISASPEGQVEAGTRYIIISMVTEEAAECRYSQGPDTGFQSMEAFSQTHTTNHSTVIHEGLSDGSSYAYYVKCMDGHGNINSNDFEVSFSIDTSDAVPPDITDSSPGESVGWEPEYISITVNTDEVAECRYSLQQGTAFSSMTVFEQTNSLNHMGSISGYSDGENYTCYIRCRDTHGNTNLETEIGFFICYEVDSDCSRDVDMNELMGFVERWVVSTEDISLHRLIEAISLWKGGSA